MPRMLCSALIVLLVSTSACGLFGATLVDDFDDDYMDPALWTLFIDGIGPVANETDGWVEVTLPPDCHEAEAPHSFGGGFKSKFLLKGDFDIKIDYVLLDWPSGSGVRVGLGMFPPKGGQLGNVQRGGFGSQESHLPTEAYCVDYQTSGGAVPTTHLSGSLRLARVGDKLTGGVLVQGQWVELHTGQFSDADYHFAFTAWSHDYAFADKPVRIAFDNFVMFYGQPVGLQDLAASRAGAALPAAKPRSALAPAAPKPAAFRSCEVIKMPSGRSFLRMPRLPAKTLPAKCGPYSRLRFALPSGQAAASK